MNNRNQLGHSLESVRGVEGAILWKYALSKLFTEEPAATRMATAFHSKRWTTTPRDGLPEYLSEIALAKVMLGHTVKGELFHLEPRVQELLGHAQASLDDWQFHESDLPSLRGMLVLDRPFSFSIAGEPALVRAISWVSLWDVRKEDNSFGLTMDVHGNEAEPPPGLDCVRSLEVFYFSVIGFNLAIGSGHWRAGQRLADSDFIGHDETSQDLLPVLRTLAAFFAFVQQKVVLVPARRAVRSERRRLPISIREQEVRVVQLRKAEYVYKTVPTPEVYAESGGGRHVGVRFWTNPFWRAQWYASEGRHKRIWIEGHWRGPDDAPVKPPVIRVHDVRR